MTQDVKLVWITPDAEALLVHMARVSNPKSQETGENSARLINYLIRNRHWSPFEMVAACVEVNTTRDIARQILRHRSFSFQEFSQRYADASALGIVKRVARLQDQKNRQSSLTIPPDDNRHEQWLRMQEDAASAALGAYEWAIEHGIAKEVARAVLPEGMTPSRLYMAGTLRSWIHYLAVRTDPATQLEHRDVATAIEAELCPYLPAVFEAIEVTQNV
jgi:thymidylate synthase (FAD)